MTYVVAAKWIAREGEEAAVATAIKELAIHSRNEPGNIGYTVHRAPDDPCVFFFYEVYVDAASFQAHVQSAHFTRLAINDAIPRLLSRERGFYNVWPV